ncbi:origin of replication complex subunit 3 [Melia azedarach]|uniref:Origin of replication complex subunit 3 n=1 Tax=Melia azedarach TaxID=155640 RepID=A0ACC1YC95_MELAZ|nr:origin of replication complex subunit 3 [Melia azedarach]
MAPSAAVDDSPFASSPETTENHLQPFFVLHKACSRKAERVSTVPVKTRRRIDLCPSPPSAEKPEVESVTEDDEIGYMNLRTESFEIVWTKIESTIKDVLRNINANVFNEIHQWVCESFSTIRSFGELTFREATQAFPIVSHASSKQLFTGLVLTKNMEFVDDLLTFKELGRHLKSQGCHVANLSSLDFMAKSGIGGCLRSLLRQFLAAPLDAADISILASWYREQGNCDNPVVVIVDDIERCCGSVLSDFILMFSEWSLKVPVILIMGVTTTLDAPRNILPSNVLQCLCPYKFTLGTPTERMDAVIEAVLVKQCSGFSVSHKVALFMRNYFVRQDGTLTSFIRALKIACVQHFSMEPLSFILKGLFLEEDGQGLQEELLPQAIFKHAFDLPSYGRYKIEEQKFESFGHCLSELKRLQSQWSTVVLCLYEAGKGDQIRLLDLLCEALDPATYNCRISDRRTKVEKDPTGSSNDSWHQQYPLSRRDHFICQAIRKVRDLPGAQLYKLLKRWEELTVDIIEIHEKLKELKSLVKVENGRSSKQDMANSFKRHSSRSQLNIVKESKALNEKAATLIECMVGDYMQPVECLPLHEIVCFQNVEKLQLALIGDPRRRIQVDLLESYKILRCSCCSRSGHSLLPSMHDTSILYNLAQEHGDHINLHDWYQSFKSKVLSSRSKGKHKSKQSPLPKKRKDTNEPDKPCEASIQARFCRAATELQITGLIRMPTKRRPDYVQRVAFGL